MSVSSEAKLRGEVDMQMHHVLDDFRKLQSVMATVMSIQLELEKENAALREGRSLGPAKAVVYDELEKVPPSLLSVALREDHPPENLEMEFAEAFPTQLHGAGEPAGTMEPRERATRQTTLVMRADSGSSAWKSCSSWVGVGMCP